MDGFCFFAHVRFENIFFSFVLIFDLMGFLLLIRAGKRQHSQPLDHSAIASPARRLHQQPADMTNMLQSARSLAHSLIHSSSLSPSLRSATALPFPAPISRSLSARRLPF